jgi:hypothetical protein
MPRKTKPRSVRPKSPDAQRYHEEVFLPRIRSFRTAIEATPLSVLVWGPGESDDLLYEQRVAIVNALRDTHIDAEMSEALISGDGHWSIGDQEFMQALASDLVVILCASPGSIAELAGFSTYQEIATKMLVFLDTKHKHSYIATGPATTVGVFGTVFYYDAPTDLISGKLSEHAIGIVRKYQLAAWYRRKLGDK